MAAPAVGGDSRASAPNRNNSIRIVTNETPAFRERLSIL
jgi:hypothetical protein